MPEQFPATYPAPRARGSDGDLALDLQAALERMARSVLFARHPTAVLADLTLGQMRCVMSLARADGQRMAELAEAVGSKLPALSQVVDRLARRGLVERRADPCDRRVVRVWLSGPARQGLEEEAAGRLEHLRNVTRWLGQARGAQVLESLGALADAAETALGSRTAEPDNAAGLSEMAERPPVTVHGAGRQK